MLDSNLILEMSWHHFPARFFSPALVCGQGEPFREREWRRGRVLRCGWGDSDDQVRRLRWSSEEPQVPPQKQRVIFHASVKRRCSWEIAESYGKKGLNKQKVLRVAWCFIGTQGSWRRDFHEQDITALSEKLLTCLQLRYSAESWPLARLLSSACQSGKLSCF